MLVSVKRNNVKLEAKHYRCFVSALSTAEVESTTLKLIFEEIENISRFVHNHSLLRRKKDQLYLKAIFINERFLQYATLYCLFD